MIDERAIIHPTAKVAADAIIGPWAIVSENSVIGSETEIGPYVFVGPNTEIGIKNKIFPYASIGSDAQHLGYKGEVTHLKIGDHNKIREFVTINRGTPDGLGVTRIGNHNYLMAYCHVAHDCTIGNHVVFANTASIAGHVEIGDYVIMGAFSGIHQYCRVGAYSFLGRAAKVYQDILPYMLVTGNPGIPTGLNSVGLRRHGFSPEATRALKRVHQLIYRRDLKMEEIRAELEKMAETIPEIQCVLTMINTSTRGIARPLRTDEKAENILTD